MTVKKNKIDSMIKELEEALAFKDDEERIEVKASFIQLDILNEVKVLMEEKNISKTELARKLKKSKSFVSQLFSGDKLLNLKTIAQFEEIFDVKFSPSFIKKNKRTNKEHYYSVEEKRNYSRVSEK